MNTTNTDTTTTMNTTDTTNTMNIMNTTNNLIITAIMAAFDTAVDAAVLRAIAPLDARIKELEAAIDYPGITVPVREYIHDSIGDALDKYDFSDMVQAGIESSTEKMIAQLDDRLDLAINEHDFSDEVREAVESAIQDHDFESQIESALDNYDFSSAMDTALENHDFSSAIDEAVESAFEDHDFSSDVESALEGYDFDSEKEVDSFQERVERALKTSTVLNDEITSNIEAALDGLTVTAECFISKK